MLTTKIIFTVLGLLFPLTIAQEIPLPGPQCQDFASSYTLSAEQIARANISNTTARNVEIAINFERSNWATGSVLNDPFYRAPANWSASLPPGTLLSVEPVTNTSLYTLPAAVSLSRITFQTTTTNGTRVPASAYILWPYLPRTFPPNTTDRIPLIGWAHGTSGVLPACAPSHIRNLWYQYTAPYAAALQGYAVVAPDYVGLGLHSTSSSSSDPSSYPSPNDPVQIPHPYLSAPTAATTLLSAISAAQHAFPRLSPHFVLAGHSQGGGAAWAAAVHLARDPVPGYLGTVAVAPSPAGPSLLALLDAARETWLAPYLAYGVWAQFPDVPREELWTEGGLGRWEGVMEGVGGCSSVASELFPSTGEGYVVPSFAEHWATRAVVEAADFAGKEVRGPVLVVQGSEDVAVRREYTEESVGRTCAAWPGSEVEYAVFEGVGHGGVMFAAQRVWLEWVADRFAGRAVGGRGCWNSSYGAAREVGDYQGEANYFLELVTSPYQVA